MGNVMYGWILYAKEDVVKNQRFIEMIREKFSIYNVKVETVIVDKSTGIEDLNRTDIPDFVINRSRFSKIAKEMEERKVRVFNSGTVTDIANDKFTTYKFLEKEVPIMPTISSQGDTVNSKRDIPYPRIVKSCYGHGGTEVFMVLNETEEKEVCAQIPHPYVIQQCCSDKGKDVRVYILGNEIVASVIRKSKDSFKSNYSLGGEVEEYKLNSHEKDLVNNILCKLKIDYGGIDFIFHKGEPVFNEIEDAVGARMLYHISNIDIVKLFVDYIIRELSN